MTARTACVATWVGAGVLTSWDVDAFAAYCALVVQVHRARDLVARGLLAKGRRDEVVTSPAWRMYRDALVLLRIYAVEFGLTPSSRSQVRALPPAALPSPDDAGEGLSS